MRDGKKQRDGSRRAAKVRRRELGKRRGKGNRGDPFGQAVSYSSGGAGYTPPLYDRIPRSERGLSRRGNLLTIAKVQTIEAEHDRLRTIRRQRRGVR